MAKISGYQKDYCEAYEKLKEDKSISIFGLINLSEMNYDIKKELVEYKFDKDKRSKDYDSRIDSCYKYMLTTFFKIDEANPIYENFKRLYKVAYLDNTEDDTNDYKDETMIKLNKIYNFINNLGEQDLKGTELLSLIRREMTDIDKPLVDPYFNLQFNELVRQSDVIRVSDIDKKMAMIPSFLEELADMESHLFRKKLFYDDYRKSVTGLTNYLFQRAGIPEIYIKPIELDEYYEYIEKINCFTNGKVVTFYKEKICDSIEDIVISPMKEVIKHSLDTEYRHESGDFDNPIITLKQNKYK